MKYMNESLEWLSPQAWEHDGVQHPRSIFTVWTDAELAAVGVYRVVEAEIAPPEGKMFLEFRYSVDGDIVRGTPVYTDEPEPAVPQVIEGWQAEVVMRIMRVDEQGESSQTVWDRVWDIIGAMNDGVEKTTAQVVLTRGRVRRDSDMLTQLAALVPLSSERVDEMFIVGNALEA